MHPAERAGHSPDHTSLPSQRTCQFPRPDLPQKPETRPAKIRDLSRFSTYPQSLSSLIRYTLKAGVAPKRGFDENYREFEREIRKGR